VSIFVALHIFFTEVGGGAPLLLVFGALLYPSERSIKLIKWFALLGALSLVIGWFVSGFYYVTYYGAVVKPVILAGEQVWSHAIFMEAKEHIFIFLPFISVILAAMAWKSGPAIIDNDNLRKSLLILTLICLVIIAEMAGMGFLVSGGARPY
jgi:magnesium-transporting ATPase (P-type)